MRGMGRHFRVIEGGRSPRKDGLDERRRFRPVGDPRYWPAQLTAPAPRRAAGRRRSGGSDLLSVAPLALSLAAATFLGVWTLTPAGFPAKASAADTESASFDFCHEGGGTNCVVDGDTLYYQGTKIRIADIDTPETHGPQCESEAELGDAATQRLQELVNAGPFSLQSTGRDEDIYGRKLRVITRDGESLGGVLVDEGLARWYAGGRRGWC